jgi:peptidoglycan/xylan/chitin deacetylase (PgdA/CDA1 family)
VDRRSFLATLISGLAVAAAGGGAAYAAGANRLDPLGQIIGATPTPTPTPTPQLIYPDGRPIPTTLPAQANIFGKFAIPRLNKIPVPGGEISALPGSGNLVALTVDDGASSETIKGYCDFIERTGFRMTFFITSQYDGWTDNVKQMRKLVDAGNLQVANHTTTHKWLTRESDSTVASQLSGCEKFIKNNFGITGHPYFRPPFGAVDARVARIAANEGYSTPVLWYGSFGDAGKTTPLAVKDMANRWMLPQSIVIGHANFPPVVQAMDYIEWLLHARNLQPVTLDDVYSRPA